MGSNELFETFSPNSDPYGFSYGRWTAEWWRWALSIPLKSNPLNDETGQYWNTHQPSSDVLFLAGNVGTANKAFPYRNIRIESGRGILLPVLNCEANALEYPDLKSHEDLIRHVVNDVDTVVVKDLYINGLRIEPVRVPSDPRVFPVTIIKDNLFGIKNQGLTDTSADGYWVFLKPLPKGHYKIDFEGSCEFGRLCAGARYQIEII